MPLFSREVGPLLSTIKNNDILKKRVEQLIKECDKTLKNKKLKNPEEKRRILFSSLISLQKECTEKLQIVHDLNEEKEPKPIKDFEKKKQNEVEKLEHCESTIKEQKNQFPDDIKVTEDICSTTSEQPVTVNEKPLDEEPGKEDGDKYKKQKKKSLDASMAGEKDTQIIENKLEDSGPSAEPRLNEEDESDEESEENYATKDFTALDFNNGQKSDETDSGDEEEDEAESSAVPHERSNSTTGTAMKTTHDSGDGKKEVVIDAQPHMNMNETGDKVETEKHDPSAPQMKRDDDEDTDDGDDEEDTADEDEETEDSEEEEEQVSNKKMDTVVSETLPSVVKKPFSDATKVIKKDANETIMEESEDEDSDEEDESDDFRSKQSVIIKATSNESIDQSKSASDHWHDLQRSVTETSISDVLHAMGAIPSGFRPSTLGANISSSDNYRMAYYLIPKLSSSNLGFSDLFFDSAKNKIKLNGVKIEKIARIKFCKQIPQVGAGMQILSRHVRVCLFDGHHILSNIHTVRVSAIGNNEKTWAFSIKTAEMMDTEQHAEIFVRTNLTGDNIGILFELCITCLRTSTEEVGEVSCGWAHIPLLDNDTGQVVSNRAYEIPVQGGTPYEDGVEVDPRISRRASSSALVAMLSGTKQPTLSIRLSSPSLEHSNLMQSLPDTLIGNTTLLPFYSYYRQILADELLRDRMDLDTTDTVHSVVLTNFPSIADTHDIMNIFRGAWIEHQRRVRRSERDPSTLLRDEEYMKKLFKDVFMDTCYPIIVLANLPPYYSQCLGSDKTRRQLLEYHQPQRLQYNSALDMFTSSDFNFHPFDLSEVSYNVLNEHCTSRPIRIEAN